MRTLTLALFICVFLVGKSAQAQQSFNLFIIEKPLENYQSSQLNGLLQESMRDLLVRVVGGEQILSRPESENYLDSARSWVKRFYFENREADGVVIGQKLVVEFDRDRLLSQFQKDGIHVWPLSHRPKTLMIGQWEQQGLKVNLSYESLQYRIDLDYRDYANLLALPVEIPQNEADFMGLRPLSLLKKSNLSSDLRDLWQAYDYVFVFKADVIGEVSSLQWSLYSIENGEKLLESDETGEGFLPLLQGSFDSLLEIYSQPYREGADSIALMQLEVENLPAYEALYEMERFLSRLKPALHEVRLVKVQGQTATFELVYQGLYADVLKLLERTPNLQMVEDSLYSGLLVGRYQP
jgi:hypothetical protein